ncbi:uncharacterized protein LOC143217559 [Lasioglossum baleicum]|uniref:uncharacterized protein LOC143217559 n=1 Tax=Lasioglossum baleicum TaxID=434251 RepID=UPI003FCDC82B
MTTTLKGIFPDPKPVTRKNFIYENVKNLRYMEQNLHVKELEKGRDSRRLNERKKINNNKYKNVASKLIPNHSTKQLEDHDINLNSHNRISSKQCIENEEKLCRKSKMPVMNKSIGTAKKMSNYSATSNNSPTKQKKQKECKTLHKSVGKMHEDVSSDPPPTLLCKSTGNEKNTKLQNKLVNQGTQTSLATDQIDNLHSEGIIRYPSKKCLNSNESTKENETSKQSDNIPRDTTNSSPNQPQEISGLPSTKEELNINLNNKECIFADNKGRVDNNSNRNYSKKGTPPSNYKKGVVPKYIRERKEAQKREEKAKAEAVDPDCPYGHVPLQESERKETLHILKKSYQDYVNELNLMPIKSDTLRAQQRKAEIEKQLNKLEEGIKVFSKQKVYVKMDA